MGHTPSRVGLVVTMLVAVLSLAPQLLPVPVAEASFPGGNGKIAYYTNDAFCNDVVVMYDDGSQPAPLSTTECDQHPDWSADGTMIAVDRSTQGDSEIVVMNADGSNARAITKNKFDDLYPAWTPDGSIVFESEGDIFRTNVDGSGRTKLVDGGGTPAVSSTGQIAWKDGDIWVMESDGSGKRNITNTPDFGEFHPNWSPDGTKIAYMRRNLDFTDVDLFVMNADGTENERLPCGPVFEFTTTSFEVIEFEGSATIEVSRRSECDPATVDYATSPGSADESDFTPTSGTLTFAEGEDTKTFVVPITDDTNPELDETVNLKLSSPCWNAPLGSFAQAVLTITTDDDDTGRRHPRTKVPPRSPKREPKATSALPGCSSAWHQEPAWSPDGTKIAFVSNRDGDNEIFVGNYFEGPDGPGISNVEQLTKNTADDDSPSWQHLTGSLRLSGRLTDANGAAVQDWPVELSGSATATTTTGIDGRYGFTVGSGNYTVTPQDTSEAEWGHLFFPESRTVTLLRNDRDVDFAAGWGLFVVNDEGGTVTSSPRGINCGDDCVHYFAPDDEVWLTATADSEHYFAGWMKSDCTGTGACRVTRHSPRTIVNGDLRHEVVATYSQPDADPLGVATIVEIKSKDSGLPAKLEYWRDGEWHPAEVGFQLRIGDKLRTDDNTIIGVEFSIGGRFGMKPDSQVSITHERQAAGERILSGVKLSQGGIWMKCDKLKEPMEIQTNGGVTAIKG